MLEYDGIDTAEGIDVVIFVIIVILKILAFLSMNHICAMVVIV